MELIITKQEPGAIACNYEELKSYIVERCEFYKTLAYTEEQIKAAKDDRASLNKLKTALKDKLKEVEKEFLQPFESFRAQINELIRIVDEPAAIIDAQIKEVEAKEKRAKRDQIDGLFNEAKKDAPPWLKLESIYNTRWENKTFSVKNIEAEINERIEEINKAIDTLNNLPAFGFEAVEEYKRTLDINRAIAEGQRLADIQKRKEEAERAQREAQAAQISSENENTIKVSSEEQKPAESQNNAKEEETKKELIMTVSGKGFRAELTAAQVDEMQRLILGFLKSKGISWHKLA